MFLKDRLLFAGILLLTSISSACLAQEMTTNGRVDELFAYPYASISSVQASYDRVMYGHDKFYNTYLLRGVYTPANNRIHFRLDLPLASANPGQGTVSGLDDISMRASFILAQHGQTFYGARLNLKFPTATQVELGSGKLVFEPSLGLLHFFSASKGTFLLGMEYSRSYAGQKDRQDINTLGIILNVDWWFKQGYVGYYPTYKYNFISQSWNIPLDVETGYMFAKNWWLAGEYILPLVNPKTFNYEFTFKLRRVFIRKS